MPYAELDELAWGAAAAAMDMAKQAQPPEVIAPPNYEDWRVLVGALPPEGHSCIHVLYRKGDGGPTDLVFVVDAPELDWSPDHEFPDWPKWTIHIGAILCEPGFMSL